MDYCKINRVVTPIAAVVPDVVSLLGQINTSPGIWFALLIWQMFFSLYLSIKATRTSLLSVGKASNAPSLSYHRSI